MRSAGATESINGRGTPRAGRRRWRCLIAAGLAFSAVGVSAATCLDPGPVTAEHYRRALTLAALNLAPPIRNESVTPRWIGTSDEFWYQRSGAAGTQYLRVDAVTGRSEPAFDHRALARAVTASTGAPLAPDGPEVDALEFTPDRTGVTVVTASGAYRCESRARTCRPVRANARELRTLEGFFYHGAVAAAEAPALQGRRVAPDGRQAVFVRDHNLWLDDLVAGTQRPLTTDGVRHHGYGALPEGSQITLAVRRAARAPPPFFTIWSPDSERVLTQRIDERTVPEYPFITWVPPDGSPTPRVEVLRYPLLGQQPFRREPVSIDVRTGRQTPLRLPPDLLDGDVDIDVLQPVGWSRDATHLYAVAFSRHLRVAHLLDIDLVRGDVRVVHREAGEPRADLHSSVYGPPNVRILGDLDEFIWWSQRDGWGHLSLHDGRTGAVKRALTAGAWLVGDIVQVDAARRQIYITGYGREPGLNPYYRNLYQVALDRPDVRRLTPEEADHPMLGAGAYVLHTDAPTLAPYEPVSPSGRYVVYGWSTPAEPPRFVIREVATQRLVRTFDAAEVDAVTAAGWRPPSTFVAKAADGSTDLYAQIYTPSDFCAGRRYPVIDFVYPHPAVHQVQWNYPALLHSSVSPAALAELGFVVVTIDGRGSVYRSRAFSQAGVGALNRTGLDDHVAVIRAMAERLPWVDGTRVGVYGRSYGGYATVRAMIEFPEVFQVGVAAAGPSSPQNMLDGIGWTAFQGAPRYANGTDRQSADGEMPLNYQALHSPAQVERIRGRLMIQMGNLDEHVAPGSTLQLVAAMVRARQNIELVLLPDETHFLSFPYESLKRWDFFVQHLLRQLPPDWPAASDHSPPLAHQER